MQNVYVSSVDRTATSASSSDFTIDLAEPTIAFSKLEVIDAQIPGSHYPISSNNANSTLVINQSATSYVVTIADGFYTPTELATAIEDGINDTALSAFTCTYSSITKKLTISHASAFIVERSHASFNMFGPLGYSSTADTSSATSQVSDHIIDLTGPVRSAFIVSRALCRGCTSNNFQSNELGNIISKIPLDTTGGITYYRDDRHDAIYFTHRVGIKKFDIKIVDESGETLSQNGVECQMQLRFS